MFDSLLLKTVRSRRSLLLSLLLHGAVLTGLCLLPENVKKFTPSGVMPHSVRIFSPTGLDLVDTSLVASRAEALKTAAGTAVSIAAQRHPPRPEPLETPPAVRAEVSLPLPGRQAFLPELPPMPPKQSRTAEKTAAWERVEPRAPVLAGEGYSARPTKFATAGRQDHSAPAPLQPANSFPAIEESHESGAKVSAAGTASAGFGAAAAGGEGLHVRAGGPARFGALEDIRAADLMGPPAGTVRSGVFGETKRASPSLSVRHAPIPAEPPALKILFKPRPEYTQEARALRVEGEVWLEVVFTREGEVKVVRILQSLGHGLDEQAVAAARAIRFQPAVRGGGAVDFTSRIGITFQLAY